MFGAWAIYFEVDTLYVNTICQNVRSLTRPCCRAQSSLAGKSANVLSLGLCSFQKSKMNLSGRNFYSVPIVWDMPRRRLQKEFY